jgi:hypothetical protein
MTNAATPNKLIEMRMTAMTDAYRLQLRDESISNVPFEERLGLLVDVEYTSRKNNRLHPVDQECRF